MAVAGTIKKNKMAAAKQRRLDRGKKKMDAKAKRQASPDKKRWF
jgi:hypothetical protein